MNTVDKLLSLDAGKIKRNKKMIRLKLSRLGNIELDFPLTEVDPEYVSELQEESLELSLDGDVKIKTYNQKVLTIIEGCPLIFKNKEIIRHFKCQTPKDLVKKLFTSGEMDFIYGEINKLNGYKDTKREKEKVKN